MLARARQCEGKSRDFLADGVARFIGTMGPLVGPFLAIPSRSSCLGWAGRNNLGVKCIPDFLAKSTDIVELSRFLFLSF